MLSKARRQEHVHNLSRSFALSVIHEQNVVYHFQLTKPEQSTTVTAMEAATAASTVEKKPPSLGKRTSFMYPAHAEREKKKQNNHRNYIYLCKVYGCVCMMLHNAMHISHAMPERK